MSRRNDDFQFHVDIIFDPLRNRKVLPTATHFDLNGFTVAMLHLSKLQVSSWQWTRSSHQFLPWLLLNTSKRWMWNLKRKIDIESDVSWIISATRTFFLFPPSQISSVIHSNISSLRGNRRLIRETTSSILHVCIESNDQARLLTTLTSLPEVTANVFTLTTIVCCRLSGYQV